MTMKSVMVSSRALGLETNISLRPQDSRPCSDTTSWTLLFSSKILTFDHFSRSGAVEADTLERLTIPIPGRPSACRDDVREVAVLYWWGLEGVPGCPGLVLLRTLVAKHNDRYGRYDGDLVVFWQKDSALLLPIRPAPFDGYSRSSNQRQRQWWF